VLSDAQKSSLGQLVHEHQGMVRAFCCRFVSDRDALDDLVQDVFVGVIGRCEELAARPAPEAAVYLRGVARNLIRRRWRQLGRDAVGGPVDQMMMREQEAALDGEVEDAEQRLNAMRRCLEQLPGRVRELVNDHYSNQIQIKQIAERLGRSASSLRMTMFRTRQRLRECIERRVGREALP